MLDGLLGLCVLILIYGLYVVYRKISVAQLYLQKNRLKKPKKSATVASTKQQIGAAESRLVLVEEYEQQLFDDAATLFMQVSRSATLKPEDAAQLQAELLKKMPAQTLTHVRQMDLAEWSVYFTFFEQSLECYVGRYGVFYTHVDRHGLEHKKVLAFQAD